MYIKMLSVEVTRKCNLKCNHCLRGNMQNLDIPFTYIDKLLDQVTSIGHLTFTGGEPTLNVPAIKYFVEQSIKKNISIDTFAIITNGIRITEDFIKICKILYDTARNSWKGRVVISNDIYHMSQRKYNDNLLKKLSFYEKKSFDMYDYNNGKDVHIEGRGEKILEAGVFSGAKPINSVSDFDESAIYLNVYGQIINGIDWSYKSQDKHYLCDVNELTEYYNNLKK